MYTTPQEMGFYIPAEWYPHKRCFMGFPCRPESWPFELSIAQASYIKVAQAIAQFEPVTLLTPLEYLDIAHDLCRKNHENITIIELAMDDAWLRDTGPTFLIDGKGNSIGINWQFDGWSGSHTDYIQDNTIAKSILESLDIQCFSAPLVLEGGAIHTDGQGTLLTTESCMLKRNPHLSIKEIEKILSDYLGISKVIWLGQGLEDDETAGHVDNLACFISPNRVLALITSDIQDSNYEILQDNLHRLHLATDAKGHSLEIITIQQPSCKRDSQGIRLAQSYINFYIANKGIIMPVFNDPADKSAIELLSHLFPYHRVYPVSAQHLIYGGGGIHCITQQQPM